MMKKKHGGDSVDNLKKLLDDREKARKEYVKNTDEILKNAHESMIKDYKKKCSRFI